MGLKNYNDFKTRPVNAGSLEYHIKDLAERATIAEEDLEAAQETLQILSKAVESLEERLITVQNNYLNVLEQLKDKANG